jgi:DNA phosphorothioation system restriction enzyme
MPLPNLNLEIAYNTGDHDLVQDFFIPCMEESILYRRATGYFTGSSIKTAARGIASIVAKNGRMQLVTSPQLSPDDVLALNRANSNKAEVLKFIVGRDLNDIEDELKRDHLNTLSWLAATGLLEIRLALRIDGDGKIDKGIYHEKFGIFSDPEENHVAFTGSPNETAGGLVSNFESFVVFKSWLDSAGHIDLNIKRFEALWNDSTNTLKVIDFTEASRELLEYYRDPDNPPKGINPDDLLASNKTNSLGFKIPHAIQLRDYQDAAVNNWFAANGQGVFKMATGSGKTITSLATAATLHEKIKLQALIIVCPYRHLVTQWAAEAAAFGLKPILAFNARDSWIDPLNQELMLSGSDENHFFSVITTNTTFASVFFQGKLPHFPEKTMFIADEVHNMGAKGNWNKMPQDIRFRMGLSATPERHGDPDGTQAIFNYFGNVVKPEFLLKDALDCGALTPYRYHPILVELTEDESERYYELSEKIAKIASFNSIESDGRSPQLDALLSQRARLIACAENKLPALRALMQDKLNNKQMLFYCGDGRVEYEPESDLMRHIEAVCTLLGRELGMQVAKFIAETSLDEREELKEKLANGDLQGLVAIRCLDEGVDIPSIQTAVILASSTNPRQFIQRRGRILRKDSKSGKTSADIYDMIVVPPEDDHVSEIERRLLRRELSRFTEFADLAQNAGQARAIILDIQKRYHLLDV